MSYALMTDHYELTMIEAALHDGSGDRRSVFEAYFREPANRFPELAKVTGLPTYGIMAGAGRIIDRLANFAFTSDEIAFLERRSFLSPTTIQRLRDFRFTGDLLIPADGERIDPAVPVVTTRGSFIECVILETIILSILNSDSSVATRAMQFRTAAGPDASLIEMGSRRTHEEHAIAAAHAACIGGFDSTSNLEAGFRHGVTTAGTAAHAWTLAHTGPDGEADAFRAQMQSLGVGTTLLVDTFDIPTGIRTAVTVARQFDVTGPGAIRIDSGNLEDQSRAARTLLDSLGATRTKIVVSGDLTVEAVQRLRSSGAPVDAYGVGSHLVGAPSLGFIYKLVAIEDEDGRMVPVAKRSATPGKATIGGEKTVVTGPNGERVIGEGPEIRALAISAGQRQQPLTTTRAHGA